MSGPRGSAARRTGMCSYQAWKAAALRSTKTSGGTATGKRRPPSSSLWFAGPVVVDLMVVVAGQEGVRGMGRLQVRIAAVLRVALAVIRQRHRLLTQMPAHARPPAGLPGRAAAVFVDVVAIVEDEVDLGLLRDMRPGGEMPVLIVLAPGGDEAQAAWLGARRGGGAGAAGAARLRPCAEAVEIGPGRGEAGDLDMDRMGQFRPGDGGAGGDDAGEAFIGRRPPRSPPWRRAACRHPGPGARGPGASRSRSRPARALRWRRRG